MEQADEGHSWQNGGDEMDEPTEALAGIDPAIVEISVKLEQAQGEQQQLPSGIKQDLHEIQSDSVGQQQPMEMSSMARLNRSIDRSIRAASNAQHSFASTPNFANPFASKFQCINAFVLPLTLFTKTSLHLPAVNGQRGRALQALLITNSLWPIVQF